MGRLLLILWLVWQYISQFDCRPKHLLRGLYNYANNGGFESGTTYGFTLYKSRLSSTVPKTGRNSGKALVRGTGTSSSASQTNSLIIEQSRIAIPGGTTVQVFLWARSLRTISAQRFKIPLDGKELGNVVAKNGDWIQVGAGSKYTVKGAVHTLQLIATGTATHGNLFEIDDITMTTLSRPNGKPLCSSLPFGSTSLLPKLVYSPSSIKHATTVPMSSHVLATTTASATESISLPSPSMYLSTSDTVHLAVTVPSSALSATEPAQLTTFQSIATSSASDKASSSDSSETSHSISLSETSRVSSSPEMVSTPGFSEDARSTSASQPVYSFSSTEIVHPSNSPKTAQSNGASESTYSSAFSEAAHTSGASEPFYSSSSLATSSSNESGLSSSSLSVSSQYSSSTVGVSPSEVSFTGSNYASPSSLTVLTTDLSSSSSVTPSPATSSLVDSSTLSASATTPSCLSLEENNVDNGGYETGKYNPRWVDTV
ncbi:hypothetical protein NX059_005632 [Plenodomus lindquistii]|nr:hypothetical protein NX059_005632 [Plenodomus lindquistii]